MNKTIYFSHTPTLLLCQINCQSKPGASNGHEIWVTEPVKICRTFERRKFEGAQCWPPRHTSSRAEPFGNRAHTVE